MIKFELTNNNVVVQHFHHYMMETPRKIILL